MTSASKPCSPRGCGTHACPAVCTHVLSIHNPRNSPDHFDTVIYTLRRLATPQLLQRPLQLNPTFSAAAVDFLLEHTALVGCATPADSSSGRASSSGDAPGGNGGTGGVAVGGRSAAGAVVCGPAAGAMAGCCGGSRSLDLIASEDDVLKAVLAWTDDMSLQCEDCRSLEGCSCGGVLSSGEAGSGIEDWGEGNAGTAGLGSASLAAHGGSCSGDQAADGAGITCIAAANAAGACTGGGGAGGGVRYCKRHQQLLCGFLCRLNLQLLDPSVLETLEGSGLISGEALVSVYRWSSRCLHAALRGRFKAGCGGGGAVVGGGGGGGAAGGAGAAGTGATASGGALCDGVFSHTKDGIEVLEARWVVMACGRR